MMRPSKILATSLLCALLASCTKPDKSPDGVNGKAAGEGAATFRVTSVKTTGMIVPFYGGGADPDAMMSALWRIPHKAKFTFTACIQDRTTRQKAGNQHFEVEIAESGQRFADLKPTEGSTGCFWWEETVPFNYFVKRSNWVVLHRYIVGTGVHQGKQPVDLAVNPWTLGDHPRDRGDAGYFLRDEPIPKENMSSVGEATGFMNEKVLGEDSLYVEDVDIQNIRRAEKDKGTMMNMNITMTPKVRFESNVGKPANISLSDGDFYVIAHLIMNGVGSGMNERLILTEPAEGDFRPKDLEQETTPGAVGFGKVIDGKLVARVNVWVDAKAAQGSLELAIKLIPKGVRGLKSFEGVYELGEMRKLSSHFSGQLNEDCREHGPCNIASYMKTASNFQALKDAKYASDNSPYLFDRMVLRFVQVQPGETTMQRVVAYAASTCVIDAFTGERPVRLPFTIRYLTAGTKDGKKDLIEDQQTEEDGCLRWSSTIEHRYYEPEEFIEQEVSIEKGSGFKRVLKFHLNPWDDKFTFGFDEREFKPQFWEDQKKRRKIKSRFFLGDFAYHTVRFQYNIDSLMNLEVRKTVLMELNPRVLRYSGIVNARKMTEPLRDGIWLLKVAIQKNYLDPAQKDTMVDVLKESQAQLRTRKETPKQQERKSANRLRKLGISVPSKEFISTQTALVRSTDGLIIQPVELNMQDLRMMRVRSNFLLELEAVNERKLVLHNQGMKNFGELIDGVIEDRKKRDAEIQKMPLLQDQEKQAQALDQKYREMVEERKDLIRQLFDKISSVLDTASTGEINMDQFKLKDEDKEAMKPLFKDLNLELQANDFTNIKIPSCSEINCNDFREPGAGLERRTFVGPVIFLSNGYKDSVRATDNLDEAKCGQEIEFDNDFEREMKIKEHELFKEADNLVAPERQNTIYRFSEYFGSLRHLCGVQVDDLVQREAEDRLLYERNIPATSSIYNFAQAYNLEILSLRDEKPMRVDMSPDSLDRCNLDLVKCMRETEDHRLPLARAMEWINGNLDLTKSWIRQIRNRFARQPEYIKTTEWDVEDLRSALFDETNRLERRYAACVLSTVNMMDTLRKSGKQPWGARLDVVQADVLDSCVKNDAEPIFFDRKLRVSKAGQEGDSYVFLGGYQMNINVGQSISVGRSNSLSWGWSVEGTDVFGAVNGVFGLKGGVASVTSGKTGPVIGIGTGVVGKTASLVKPLSVKLNASSSFSDSEGTSISESTYLVAQIAKFRVRLDEFERCVVLTYTPQFQKALMLQGRFSWNEKDFGPMHPVLVCEGRQNSKPRFVDETYFYFTQHFTEGDMLDQADLYNHPWLLALRGYRDFDAFVDMIQGQEVVDMKNFVNGVFSPKTRPVYWPLTHMKEVYRQVVPSFPGFYTELRAEEVGPDFPLEKKRCGEQDPRSGCDPNLKTIDYDINNEVFNAGRKVDPRRQ
jgi:hypothetical protein